VIAIFAAILATSPQTSCLLHFSANPVGCAQQIRAVARPHGASRIFGSTSGKTLLYASEPFASTVTISTVTATAITPIGQLTFNGAVPFDMTVDSSENLYVVVIGGSAPPSVEVFPRGATTPSKIYTNDLSGPLDVAVDAHGNLYVANLVSSKSCNVLIYAKGSMKPTSVITTVPGCPNALALDSSSNLYVTYVYYPPKGLWQTDVMKYASGSTTGTRLHLTAPGLNDFYGIAVDAKGDVVVGNSQEDGSIGQLLVFPPGAHTPSNTIEYDGWFPLYFTLYGDRFFTQSFLPQGTSSMYTLGTVPAEFDYPSGTERIVGNPELAGVSFYFGFAVSP
jgi:hypothetical protein